MKRPHPVELVNWHQCQEAARRLGLLLPTEAQWEYGARGGTSTPWWCAADLESLLEKPLACNLCDAAMGRQEPNTAHDPRLDDGHVIHGAVDAFLPNPFGVHGVIGNVMEWCRDRYCGGDAWLPARAGDGLRDDPDSRLVTLRGAGFTDLPIASRVSRRWPDIPEDADMDVGLRPVCALER